MKDKIFNASALLAASLTILIITSVSALYTFGVLPNYLPIEGSLAHEVRTGQASILLSVVLYSVQTAFIALAAMMTFVTFHNYRDVTLEASPENTLVAA